MWVCLRLGLPEKTLEPIRWCFSERKGLVSILVGGILQCVQTSAHLVTGSLSYCDNTAHLPHSPELQGDCPCLLPGPSSDPLRLPYPTLTASSSSFSQIRLSQAQRRQCDSGPSLNWLVVELGFLFRCILYWVCCERQHRLLIPPKQAVWTI